jgi:quercetin dioxygenase-like cupin family protein
MGEDYTVCSDIAALDIPPDGILSRTLYNDEHVKAVLFAFAPGQELSEHTASTPAIIHVLKGEASLTLGNDTVDAKAGTWVHMPAGLRHGVRARTPLVMLLHLLKTGEGGHQ